MKIGCSVKMLSRLFADLCKQMRPVRFQMSESDEMNTTSLNNGSQSKCPNAARAMPIHKASGMI